MWALLSNIKISNIFLILSFILGIVLGSLVIGIPIGKYVEHSKNSVVIASLNTAYLSEIDKYKSNETLLLKNIDDWKSAYTLARNTSITAIQSQNNNTASVNKVTDKLKAKSNTHIIIREIKNECKASDIIVNTDASDRLRNCFTSPDPSTCSNN